jgi:hypothetical protein
LRDKKIKEGLFLRALSFSSLKKNNNNYNVVFRYFVLFPNTFNPEREKQNINVKRKKIEKNLFFSLSLVRSDNMHFGPGFLAPSHCESKTYQKRTRKQIEK